ncbi:MAG: hypothetical protein GY857_08780 [Desulfobacula sp.]|nr:hypothetical protein [Desulfobacula sp.]
MKHPTKSPNSKIKSSQNDEKFAIELNKVPIVWDLNNSNLSFFGIDSALFWTDPSLIRMLLPLAEEVGKDLFRLLVAYSSSLGTEEDYHSMISTLGNDFKEGFLAWGKAVSTAGWGVFEMPEFNPDDNEATVIVYNSWEISMQRNLPSEKRWGCPFLQGKIIGIFNNAFKTQCWVDDICHYNSTKPYTEFKIFPSPKTIDDELKKLRYQRMFEKEQELANKVEDKTAELQQAQQKIEEYSKTLEQKVVERTAELLKTNNQLQNEIIFRKGIEAKKELLILDLQKTLKEVKALRGLLPICAHCKKIRDDKGYWNQIESYIQQHSEAQFSHGMCPDCSDELYGKEKWYVKMKDKQENK